MNFLANPINGEEGGVLLETGWRKNEGPGRDRMASGPNLIS